MEERKNSGAYVAVILAIIGLLVGFGIAKAVDNKNNDAMTATTATATPAPNSGTKAGDLRATLVTLGVEHMHLTDQAVDAALDGSGDAAALKARLIKNGEDISGAVGSIYGTDAQAQFQTLWNNHLNDFVTYAVAGKKKDDAGKAAALADIQTNYTAPISKLLSGANPNLPETTLLAAFGDHVTMTAGVIDDHNAGDYAKEATDLIAADQHIQGLMSTLAGAIVKQYPEKF